MQQSLTQVAPSGTQARPPVNGPNPPPQVAPSMLDLTHYVMGDVVAPPPVVAPAQSPRVQEQPSPTAISYTDLLAREAAEAEQRRARPAPRQPAAPPPRAVPENPNAERGDGGNGIREVAQETWRSLNPFNRSAFEKHRDLMRDPDHQWDGVRISPLAYDAEVKDTFGVRAVHPVSGRRNVPHNGTDFRLDLTGETRSPVVAPVGGFLSIDRNRRGGEGVSLILYGDDGLMYKLYHLEEGSIPARLQNAGSRRGTDRIEIGEFMANAGGTGAVTGPHLHFEVWEPNRNPPRGPWDYHAVNPDRHYEENLSRRGRVLQADIDQPRRPGAGQLQIQLVEAHEMRELHGREPAMQQVSSGPQPYHQAVEEGFGAVRYTPDGAREGSHVQPATTPARGASPARGGNQPT